MSRVPARRARPRCPAGTQAAAGLRRRMAPAWAVSPLRSPRGPLGPSGSNSVSRVPAVRYIFGYFYPPRESVRRTGTDGEDVGWRGRRVKSHVVGLTPPVALARQLVANNELFARVYAECCGVEPDGGLPGVVRVEVYHSENRVCRAGALREADYLRLVSVMKTQVTKQMQGRMRPAEQVEARDERRDVLLGRRDAVGVLPVPRPVLVLLRVQVLLAARQQGDVLAQLVARVEAPGRRQHRGEHRADPERRRPAVLQVRGEDVLGVDEEVRPHVRGRRAGQLAKVLGQLPGGVAPGEVRVGLVEADGPERVHHRGPGEGLGKEEHVGVATRDLGQQPVPE